MTPSPGAVNAVATTGIYCRPGCGARPRPANVAPFPSPVAAEAAGYRSCLRCRPDRHLVPAPVGGVPAPVAAALELISGGFLDRFDEHALADRVGYSPRQLRRLFERHVGATPAFVARSRRAHFARRLLDETDLTLPVIAGAAGFGSVRQLHRVTEAIFGFPPRELRRRRRRGDVLTADGGLRLRLAVPEPLDRPALLDHLGARAVPGVEAVDGGVYRRTLVVCGNPGVIEVDLTGHDHVGLIAHLPTFDSIIDDVARVRAVLGLDADAGPAIDHLAADPVLGPLVRARPGLRVPGAWDRFETAIRVVVGQQVSVGGAATITGRIVERAGAPIGGSVLGLERLFPTPDALVDLDPRDLGMPRGRVRTLQRLASALLDGSLDLYGPADPASLRAQLLALPGVGPWTAQMILLRTGRDPDAFPADDLGLRRSLAARLGRSLPVSSDELTAHAEAWRPHRALAAQHLWTADSIPTTMETS